jgi:hypothetical protein
LRLQALISASRRASASLCRLRAVFGRLHGRARPGLRLAVEAALGDGDPVQGNRRADAEPVGPAHLDQGGIAQIAHRDEEAVLARGQVDGDRPRDLGALGIDQRLGDVGAQGEVIGQRQPKAGSAQARWWRENASGTPSMSIRWKGSPVSFGYSITVGCQPFFSTRLPSVSAICTAFSAAPLRRLSLTHQRFSPFSTVESWRMRLMKVA